MKKQNTFILLALTFLAISQHLKAADTVDKIVAVVDNKIITQSDIEEAVRHYSKIANVSPDQVRRGILQDLINEKIIAEELEKAGISISEDEVDRALQDLLQKRQTTLEKMQADLIRQGIAMIDVRDHLRRQLLRDRFLQRVIYPRVRISDFDLQEFYRQHKDQFLGYEKIRFLEILLTRESTPAGQNPQVFANSLAGQLRKGANFKEMVKKYSRGAYAAKGGDSGLLNTSSLRPDLVNMLSQLSVNSVSNPVPTEGGIFIFKVVDKQGRGIRPFEQVKDLVSQAYGDKKVYEEMEAYLMAARSRHFVEIKKN